MAGKRSYDDGCAAAHALELVGERWALLVARELMLGPKRFTDLRASLPGISPNVLTQRLEEMEQAAIIRRRRLPPPAASWVYELTEWGLELEPIIQSIGRWAARSPVMPMGRPMSLNSVILSLRTMFSADKAGDFAACLELRLQDHVFQAQVRDGVLDISPGAAHKPDAIIETNPDLLAGIIYGGVSIADAAAGGGLRLTGDETVVRRFVTLFPLPEKAPAAEMV